MNFLQVGAAGFRAVVFVERGKCKQNNKRVRFKRNIGNKYRQFVAPLRHIKSGKKGKLNGERIL